jgi:hypothetical protein
MKRLEFFCGYKASERKINTSALRTIPALEIHEWILAAVTGSLEEMWLYLLFVSFYGFIT